MKKFKIFLAFYFMIVLTSFGMTTVKVIKGETGKDTRSGYYIELLNFLLERTKDTYGDFEIKESTTDIVQSRTLKEIQNGNNINLIWTMTSSEREKDLYPIRVPLLKGLLGHRVFIIKKGTEGKFKDIKTFDDLKKLKPGQGHDWPDTEILKASGITVVTSPKYEALFKMLLANRFDYFPRGITEPWQEIKSFGDGELVVEKNILIYYPAPMYFFVSRDNKALSQRLEEGFNRIIADGSFNEFFYNHPQMKEMFELSDISNRKIFEIANPLLTTETKELLTQKKYWYTQGEEKIYTK